MDTSYTEFTLTQNNLNTEIPFCLSKIQFSDLRFRFQREDFESSGHDEKATEAFRFASAAFLLFMAAQPLSRYLCSTPRRHQTTRRYHRLFHLHIGKKWLVSYYDTNHFSVQHLSYASSITAPCRSCFSPCSRFCCRSRTYPRHTRHDWGLRFVSSQSRGHRPYPPVHYR